MNYTCKKLPGEPITIWTPLKTWNAERDIPQANVKLVALWDAADSFIFHIVNLEKHILSIADMLRHITNAVYGSTALYAHPSLREILIVSTDPALHSLIKQAQTEPSAVIHDIRHFASLDAALAYARAQP